MGVRTSARRNVVSLECDLWHLPGSAHDLRVLARVANRDFVMLFGQTLVRSSLRRKWRLYRLIRLRLLRAVRSARDDRLEMIW